MRPISSGATLWLWLGGVAVVVVVFVVIVGWKLHDNRMSSELTTAISRRDHQRAMEILRSKPHLANDRYLYGDTPLLLAVEQDDPKMVRILLTHGADVHADSSRLGLPLHVAVRQSTRTDIIADLLSAGADIDGQSRAHPTYLTATALHTAATYARLDILTFLLEKGANVNAQAYDGSTALYVALTNRQTSIEERKMVVELLLRYGADINALNNEGETPLDTAESGVDTGDIPAMLIERGAKHGVKLP